MTTIYLHKYANALLPAHDSDVQVIAKWKTGDYVECQVSRPRNPAFHRKFFALLNYAFECWEPFVEQDWAGDECKRMRGPPEKNFTRFRRDIAIACGHYTLTVDLKGKVHAEAKSISFASMDDDEFSALYERAITYLIKHAILTNQDRDEVNAVVEQLLGFA